MKNTYFLSSRKDKKGTKLVSQIELFCKRKNISLKSNILIEVTESMISKSKFNTVKITIT
jgi:hypothetical protein